MAHVQHENLKLDKLIYLFKHIIKRIAQWLPVQKQTKTLSPPDKDPLWDQNTKSRHLFYLYILKRKRIVSPT